MPLLNKDDKYYSPDTDDSPIGDRILKCAEVLQVDLSIVGTEKEKLTQTFKDNYHKLAVALHPDKNKASDATLAYQSVQSCYNFLGENIAMVCFMQMQKNRGYKPVPIKNYHPYTYPPFATPMKYTHPESKAHTKPKPFNTTYGKNPFFTHSNNLDSKHKTKSHVENYRYDKYAFMLPTPDIDQNQLSDIKKKTKAFYLEKDKTKEINKFYTEATEEDKFIHILLALDAINEDSKKKKRMNITHFDGTLLKEIAPYIAADTTRISQFLKRVQYNFYGILRSFLFSGSNEILLNASCKDTKKKDLTFNQIIYIFETMLDTWSERPTVDLVEFSSTISSFQKTDEGKLSAYLAVWRYINLDVYAAGLFTQSFNKDFFHKDTINFFKSLLRTMFASGDLIFSKELFSALLKSKKFEFKQKEISHKNKLIDFYFEERFFSIFIGQIPHIKKEKQVTNIITYLRLIILFQAMDPEYFKQEVTKIQEVIINENDLLEQVRFKLTEETDISPEWKLTFIQKIENALACKPQTDANVGGVPLMRPM